MTVTTQRLKHAVALAQHRNFARAAESLHITQPALSRSIQALERSLGASLFDRNPKAVEPTVFGELVISSASEILHSVSEMQRNVDLLRGCAIGEVVLGAGPAVADGLIGDAIGRLSNAHPRIKVTLRIDSWEVLTESLHGRSIEFFVGEFTEALADPALEVTQLSPRQLLFFARAGHPLAEKTSLSLSQLHRYPLAGPRIPPRFESLLRNGNEGAAWWGDHPEIPPAIQCESFTVLKTIVTASDAVSAAPSTVIADEVRKGLLTPLQVRLPDLHTQFGIVKLRHRRLSPAAEALIEQLMLQDKKSAGLEDRG